MDAMGIRNLEMGRTRSLLAQVLGKPQQAGDRMEAGAQMYKLNLLGATLFERGVQAQQRLAGAYETRTEDKKRLAAQAATETYTIEDKLKGIEIDGITVYGEEGTEFEVTEEGEIILKKGEITKIRIEEKGKFKYKGETYEAYGKATFRFEYGELVGAYFEEGGRFTVGGVEIEVTGKVLFTPAYAGKGPEGVRPLHYMTLYEGATVTIEGQTFEHVPGTYTTEYYGGGPKSYGGLGSYSLAWLEFEDPEEAGETDVISAIPMLYAEEPTPAAVSKYVETVRGFEEEGLIELQAGYIAQVKGFLFGPGEAAEREAAAIQFILGYGIDGTDEPDEPDDVDGPDEPDEPEVTTITVTAGTEEAEEIKEQYGVEVTHGKVKLTFEDEKLTKIESVGEGIWEVKTQIDGEEETIKGKLATVEIGETEEGEKTLTVTLEEGGWVKLKHPILDGVKLWTHAKAEAYKEKYGEEGVEITEEGKVVLKFKRVDGWELL
jgi:hypothetical protein